MGVKQSHGEEYAGSRKDLSKGGERSQHGTWSSVSQVSWADSYLQFGLPAECCPSCQHLNQ